MDEAVDPSLVHDELTDVTIVFTADVDVDAGADDDVPELAIKRGSLRGADMSNTPVAGSARTQYNRDNADFMMYLWDSDGDVGVTL
jgi:hypothetical protein